jgi:hypothetical protein
MLILVPDPEIPLVWLIITPEAFQPKLATSPSALLFYVS